MIMLRSISCIKCVLHQQDQFLSRNVNCIVNRLGVDRSYVLGNGIQLLKSAYCDDVSDCDKAILGMIKELQDCDNFVIDGFNQTELQLFIYNLCTF